MTGPYRDPSVASCGLPPRFAGELFAELEPGELVLWSGIPRGVALARRALAELVMPLAFNGFVLGLVAACSQEGGPLVLGAVPLLALGLPLFRAPIGAWQAVRTTFYAVTDRRALIFDADAIISVDREDIVAVRVRDLGGGNVGDIILIVRAPSPSRTALYGVHEARAVARWLGAA